MTRRVRFTPLLAAGVFLAWVGAARAGEVPFAPAAIVAAADMPQSVVAADVDRDGDLDVLSGDLLVARISWYENAAGNGTVWVPRTIATSDGFVETVGAADLDGDGDVDAASASFDGTIAWHDNTAGNGTTWITRTVGTVYSGGFALVAGDVEGDGDLDLVACALNGLVAWYENTAGNGSSWTMHTVGMGGVFSRSLAAADVDRDGDIDLVSTAVQDDQVVWHENVAGDGSAWTRRTLSTAADGAVRATPADLDRDGDLDVLVALREGQAVVWYENTAGNGTTWTVRTVMTGLDFAEAVFVHDLDGDGDLDALSGWFSSAGSPSLAWHENTAGDASAWTNHTLATSGDAYAVAVADLDGDGDPDLLSGSVLLDQVRWHRNDSIHRTACFEPNRTIFSTDSPLGSAAADIDRDGDLDVFATSLIAGPVTWHRNDSGGAAWTPFTVATGLGAFTIDASDVDGDGDPDALTGPSAVQPASWIENLGDGAAWLTQAIATPGAPPGFDLRGADIDGDGDVDGLSSSASALSWFENQDGQGDLWSLHTIATIADGGGARAVDLDRDGDLDVLGGETPLAWHENTAGNGSAWTTRTISLTGADYVAPLDLDSDGDLDVIGSNITSSPGVRWYENLAGNGTSWAAHSLATLFDLLELETRDVDGDGDLDLVAGLGLAQLLWLERTGPGVAFALHTIATDAGGLGRISSPDLDGDGGPDVLWASQLGDAVLWNRNGRGQVVFGLADQVPASANNNDVFSILRLVVTHGGRAGDSDLELARLGLLFEEGPGDPLTSVEANALVEELRIYRDANGNGTFDPGIDTLVATVPTLALAAGVQVVTFADGDPNVQVAFGAPRTYFVVAQLTANANQQAPNQFRVTHLAVGPSATSAEDRSAGIRLTIACPADFPSRMIGPVTPVELMRFTIE